MGRTAGSKNCAKKREEKIPPGLKFRLVKKTEKYEIWENTPKLSKLQMRLTAVALAPQIRKFYEDPENMAKFEKWLAEKKAREAAMAESEGQAGG